MSRAAIAAVRIVAIGRMGHGPEAELFARYAGRMRPPPVLVEVAEARGSPAEIKRREAAALLGAIQHGAFVVALDQGGVGLDSEQLAALLSERASACFVLGGAEGLDAAVLARADRVLSLGRMTWPHLLARAMLAEQLYRAYSMAIGHPYHRGGRP